VENKQLLLSKKGRRAESALQWKRQDLDEQKDKGRDTSLSVCSDEHGTMEASRSVKTNNGWCRRWERRTNHHRNRGSEIGCNMLCTRERLLNLDVAKELS